MSKFIAENGQVLIFSTTGRIAWKGQPNGGSVKKVIELQGGKAAIVLLDSDSWKSAYGLNVVRIDDSGKVVWFAKDVTGNLSGDVITEVSFLDDSLSAKTWFGKKVAIDIATGKVTYESFTK